MASTKSKCKVCGAEGTVKYLSSAQHMKTKRHQGIAMAPKSTSDKTGKKHVEYVKYIAKKIEEDGKTAVREKWKLAKQAQRAEKKKSEEIVKEKVTEVSGVTNEKILKFVSTLASDLKKVTEKETPKNEILKDRITKNAKQMVYLLKADTSCNNIVEYLIANVPEKANEKKNLTVEKRQANKIKRIKDHLGNIRRIHAKIYPNKVLDCSSKAFEFANNVSLVKETILRTYPEFNTNKQYFSSFYYFTNYLKGFDESSKQYHELMKWASAQGSKKTDDNTLPSKDVNNAMKWNDILDLDSKVKKYGTTNKDNFIFYALYKCYTSIPPRRLSDFRLMKVVYRKNIKDMLKNQRETNPIVIDNEGGDELAEIDSYDDEAAVQKKIDMKDDAFKLDRNFNYVILSDKGTPTLLIFNNYKTGALKIYGTQYNNNLPNDLKQVLEEYIKKDKLKNGNFLFPVEGKNNNFLNASDFSALVMNPFRAVADKNLGLNLLRHAYISWFFPKAKSNTERKKIVTAMATSVAMAQNVYLYNELTQDAPPLYSEDD